MADVEEKGETGGILMFGGLAVWVAALLVLFFFPGTFRSGHQGVFEAIMIALGVLGAVLIGRGWAMRRGSGE